MRGWIGRDGKLAQADRSEIWLPATRGCRDQTPHLQIKLGEADDGIELFDGSIAPFNCTLVERLVVTGRRESASPKIDETIAWVGGGGDVSTCRNWSADGYDFS
jgi:hypothetical protein